MYRIQALCFYISHLKWYMSYTAVQKPKKCLLVCLVCLPAGETYQICE
jgi:hypothetical protein